MGTLRWNRVRQPSLDGPPGSRGVMRVGWIRWAGLALLVLVFSVGGRVGVPLPGAPLPSASGPTGGSAPAAPTALTAAASSTVGAERPEFAVVRRNERLIARGGGLETAFDSAGPVVSTLGAQLPLHLASIGRSGRLARVAPAGPVAKGNRVSYRRGALEEWYLNGPFGLEQGFTLHQRPAGAGRLTLAVQVTGSLLPRRSGAEVVFADSGGKALARYGGLYALDASRKTLPAKLELSRRTLLLHVDDAGARYPLTIDPFIQLGEKLTGGGESGNGRFGYSVALSADGSTALVGGYADDGNKGAAWVFTRSGGIWSQQGGKLTGSGATGDARFGVSVALSVDGSTALVGGYSDNGGKGAAWVFTRSGSAWNQQGGKLTGSGETGNGSFGMSVALSADGSTALIGGNTDDANKGAAWVFTRSGGAWTQQGGKLTGSGETGNGRFGLSAALSSDGATALIGGSSDDGGKGAAWVFTRSGSAWSQQGGKLTGSGETGNGGFANSVALSSDGSTALIGGAFDDGNKGAAWVFTRSGSAWSQQGGKLTGSGETGNGLFGFGVALSSDGSTALIGGSSDDAGKGAAWTFSRSGGIWTQQGGKLTGANENGNGSFGVSVALAADGRTALIGGHSDDASKGAAWLFNNAAPVVTGIKPGSGPASGGTLVTIMGTNFTGATGVKFGSAAATLSKIVSDSEINAVSPPGQEGSVDVTVMNANGMSATSSTATFIYGSPIVARIVYATVLGKGKQRLLAVRIRVSRTARAQVKLIARGVTRFQKAFPVKGGPNELKAPLAPRFKQGVYQMRITLTAKNIPSKVYRATVLVPG
jgi:hypothetical protein